MARLRSRVTGFLGIIGPESTSRPLARALPGPASARFVEWLDGDKNPVAVLASGCLTWGVHVSLVGSLDNFDELADELAGHGHVVASGADHELAAHAYEQWGELFVERLCGMFAIAVWDPRTQLLLLARDRAGARSLHYCARGETLSFASDLTRLRTLADVSAEIDPRAIDAYLTFQAVPAPLSIYRSVQKLPAAHLLTWSHGASALRRYWSLDFSEKRRRPLGEAAEELSDVLGRVTAQVTGRRSWGLMLSGGLDSSVLLALLSQATPGPVRTFTLAFREKRRDAESSRAVASQFGTEHQVFEVEPVIGQVLPQIFASYHEPYANPSALTIPHTASLLRGKSEIFLMGEGADEVFGGRHRHLASAMIARLQDIPGAAALAAVCARWPLGRLAIALDGVARSAVDRHLSWMATFPPEAKADLYTAELTAGIDCDCPRTLLGRLIPDRAHPVDQALAADYGLWVPEVLWTNLDPGQGAAGLDLRCPFLDHRVVEFAMRLPSGLRVGWTTSKLVLRRLGRDRKIRPPRGAWQAQAKISLAALLRGELRPLLEESLVGSRSLARGYFRAAALRQTIDEHLAGYRDHSRRLWALIMLEQWHRHRFDR